MLINILHNIILMFITSYCDIKVKTRKRKMAILIIIRVIIITGNNNFFKIRFYLITTS